MFNSNFVYLKGIQSVQGILIWEAFSNWTFVRLFASSCNVSKISSKWVFGGEIYQLSFLRHFCSGECLHYIISYTITIFYLQLREFWIPILTWMSWRIWLLLWIHWRSVAWLYRSEIFWLSEKWNSKIAFKIK